MNWAILTGRYGLRGGVSDYTTLVAEQLANAGDEVTVYASSPSISQLAEQRFHVVELPGSFGPSAQRALDRAFKARIPDRVLVQYVPQAFGRRAMNIPFCLWLFARRKRYPIWVMFHEVAVRFSSRPPLRHNLLALTTNIMARLTARAASRIFIGALAWERTLRPMIPRQKQMLWTPVPSNIPVIEDPEGVMNARRRYLGAGTRLVGHFGTYGKWSAEPLAVAVPILLLQRPEISLLLLGLHSAEFRAELVKMYPELADRVGAPGELPAPEVSRHLQACDLMLQPYPDGITTRRGSAMMVLAHGVPMVTTSGSLTEGIWREYRAVHVTPAGNPGQLARHASRLLNEPDELKRLGAAGHALYEERFALRHTITALRELSADIVPV